ncbi:hypothetical protein ACJX0J_010954, partial [Zea mays]
HRYIKNKIKKYIQRNVGLKLWPNKADKKILSIFFAYFGTTIVIHIAQSNDENTHRVINKIITMGLRLYSTKIGVVNTYMTDLQCFQDTLIFTCAGLAICAARIEGFIFLTRKQHQSLLPVNLTVYSFLLLDMFIVYANMFMIAWQA